jgi:hypothetical protein
MMCLWIFLLKFDYQLTLYVELYLLISIDSPPRLLSCSYLQNFVFFLIIFLLKIMHISSVRKSWSLYHIPLSFSYSCCLILQTC